MTPRALEGPEVGPRTDTSARGSYAAKAQRRRRTKAERRKIVEETFTQGISVARVACSHAVDANHVHQWRRLYELGLLNEDSGEGALLPVRIVESSSASGDLTTEDQPVSRAKAGGTICIELERARVWVDGEADACTVRAVSEWREPELRIDLVTVAAR